MKSPALKAAVPSPINALLAVLSAIMLILAFPDFELWFLAWFALVPLFFAVEREKQSSAKSFVLGWIWGVCFFFGSCWWLTHAPVTYGGIPAPIAYALLFLASSVVGLFPALFAAVFALFLRRFGAWGIWSAPFLWTAVEFLRFWTTGNNWNAVAYSQAFDRNSIRLASVGGIYLVGFILACLNSLYAYGLVTKSKRAGILISTVPFAFIIASSLRLESSYFDSAGQTTIVAIQPNVPMSGLRYEDRMRLLDRHVKLAENALREINEQRTTNDERRTTVIFPESPMNFMYERDREFQAYLREFTTRNNVSVLFNAAEPHGADGLYNSAVLVNERGEKISQYNKIHLVPFGEYVPLPAPLASVVPTMVGNFEIGNSYDLMPIGDARAGIMICFESHFPNLSRRFAADGADVLIELTNDGYLGNTPILRQHLANAVFRAVETGRPVVRVTNTGITAFIDENGKIYDETAPYKEEVRVWSLKKTNAAPTFYVKYGDWFAWTCSIASLLLLIISFWKRVQNEE